MPWNGAGAFSRLRSWVDDAAAGIKIRADFHDIEDDNFAAGISNCIARDGQSVVIQNIPMNSKRITTLADPTDPQDASTKAYADTKLPLAGGTITGSLTVNGQITTTGYRCRSGLNGSYGGNWFNFLWNGNLQVWIDNYNFGNLATQSYVEQRASDWAHAVADPKVNRSGDTMTGGLTVQGELVAATNYIRFIQSGGPGYLQYQGGSTYYLGSAGNIWHTGNLAPVTSARWIDAGQQQLAGYGWSDWGNLYSVYALYKEQSTGFPVTYVKIHYLQILVPSGWVTVS